MYVLIKSSVFLFRWPFFFFLSGKNEALIQWLLESELSFPK